MISDETQIITYTVPRAWPLNQRADDMATDHYAQHRRRGRKTCRCFSCKIVKGSTAPLFVPALSIAPDMEATQVLRPPTPPEGYEHLDPGKYVPWGAHMIVEPADEPAKRRPWVTVIVLGAVFVAVGIAAGLSVLGVI